MDQIYIAAYSIFGGIHLPDNIKSIELINCENYQFVLTTDPTSFFKEIDEANALLTHHFKKSKTALIKHLNIKNDNSQSIIQEVIENETREIQQKRKEKNCNNLLLILIVRDQLKGQIQPTGMRYGKYFLSHNLLNKDNYAEKYKEIFESMKLSLCIESQNKPMFRFYEDGIYAITKDNEIIYNFDVTSATAFGSTDVRIEDKDKYLSRFNAIQKQKDLNSVGRLYCQLIDLDNDNLRKFISGWMALERLISKTFINFESQFFNPLLKADQPKIRKTVISTIKRIMNDKYKLMDKFQIVSTILFPTSPENEIEKDIELFKLLKENRDSILHGNNFTESELPVKELLNLLTKYYVAAVNINNNISK